MYALLALNASLAMLGMVRLLTAPPLSPPRGFHGGEEDSTRSEERTFFFPPVNCRPTTVGRGIEGGPTAWLLYILFTAATLWTHNTALLFWAATNVAFLGWTVLAHVRETGFLAPKPGFYPPMIPVDRQETGFFKAKNPVSRSLSGWLLAQLAILLLWSPWLAPFIRQAAGVDREFWIPAPTWSAFAGTLNAFLSAFLPSQGAWLTLAWLAAFILLCGGIHALWKKRVRLALLVSLFVTPIAGELLVSLRRPIYYTRTLIWATIPLYTLLAIGAAWALSIRYGPRRRVPPVVIAVLLALGVLVTANARSLQNYYQAFRKEAWDQAAGHVAQHVQSGDLLLFNASWVQLPFEFYFDPSVPVVRHGLPVDLFDRGVLEPKMSEADLPYLGSLIQGHNRIWLIYSHHWYTDPEGLIPEALEKRGRLQDHQRFRGIDVYRYTMPEP
jgi:hypothetical protein